MRKHAYIKTVTKHDTGNVILLITHHLYTNVQNIHHKRYLKLNYGS